MPPSARRGLVDEGRLRAAGLSGSAAAEKAVLFARALTALDTLRRDTPDDADSADAFWVPGRVEFLGKHTDYAGGRSLLCAIERGICLVAAARADPRVRIVDAARPGEVVEGTLDAAADAADAVDAADTDVAGHASSASPSWATYPQAVVRRLARNFAPLARGADVAFVSDLPPAAGMSSSSALMIAVFLALAEVNRLAERDAYRQAVRNREALAAYLGTIENGQSFGALAGDAGVGTFGGSQDHTAILCARPDALVQYAFCPVRFERAIPLPGDLTFVIASSGVVAEKTGAARERYNRASLAVAEIVARWNAATGRGDATLADALASTPTARRTLGAMLAEGRAAGGRALADRVEQFVRESDELIPAAALALARGDLARLGAVVDRSQAGAERALGNQVPETVWLARAARTEGAVAASAFGAGFGGSVWALVPTAGAEAVRARWAERYAARFPEAAARSTFLVTRPGPAATRLYGSSRLARSF